MSEAGLEFSDVSPWRTSLASTTAGDTHLQKAHHSNTVQKLSPMSFPESQEEGSQTDFLSHGRSSAPQEMWLQELVSTIQQQFRGSPARTESQSDRGLDPQSSNRISSATSRSPISARPFWETWFHPADTASSKEQEVEELKAKLQQLEDTDSMQVAELRCRVSSLEDENKILKTAVKQKTENLREQLNTVEQLVQEIQKAETGFQKQAKIQLERAFSSATETHLTAPSKFTVTPCVFLRAGNLEHFHMGLDVFNGRPVGDNIETQMKMEFSAKHEWIAHNSGFEIRTDLETEWEFVVNPKPKRRYPAMKPGPSDEAGPETEVIWSGVRPYRSPKLLCEFMHMDITKKAKLTIAEVIAIRLYTGPAYVPINAGLRAGGREREDKTIRNFPVTCSVLNSAIRKLAQVTKVEEGRMLYRGLSGVALTEDVITRRNFVEFGFSSASPDRAVALQYSQYKRDKLPTLLEIEVGQIDNGASFKDFSQFPLEKEVCLPPLSSFELVTGSRKEVLDEIEVCIFRLKLNVNLKARTLEELTAARKDATKDFSRMLSLEYEEISGGRKSEKLRELTEAEVSVPLPEFFNNNINFWSVQRKLFDTYKEEMGEAAEEFKAAAQRLPAEEWVEKVLLLRKALELTRRSTEGFQEALRVSQLVVDAVPKKEEGDAEPMDALALDALQAHTELLIEAGGQDNLRSALALANRSVTERQGASSPTKHKLLLAAFGGGAQAAMECKQERSEELDELEPQAKLELATALYWRGRVNVQLKDWAAADADVTQALQIRRAILDKKKCGQEQDLDGTERRGAEAEVGAAGPAAEVPKTLSLQGQILFGQGKLAEALEVHTEAKLLREKLFGKEHLEVAASLSNIAKALQAQAKEKLRKEDSQQKLMEAKEVQLQALQIQRKHLGKQHTYVAFTEEGLGKILVEEGRLQEARQQFSDALETARKTRHDDLTKRLEASIEALDVLKQEKMEEAKSTIDEAGRLQKDQWLRRVELLRKALDLTRWSTEGFCEALKVSKLVVAALPGQLKVKELNPEEQKVALEALQDHTELLIEAGGAENFTEAVGAADRVVETRLAQRGSGEGGVTERERKERDACLAAAYYWRARARVQLKKFDEAKPDVAESVRMRKEVLGHEHQEIPKTLSLQGQILFGQGKLAEALEVHTEAKLLREKLFGKEHLEVAASLSNIAKALKAKAKALEEDTQQKLGREASQKKLMEAKEAQLQALRIQRKHLGKQHKYVAFTEVDLADTLVKEGSKEEAKGYLKMARSTAQFLKDDGFVKKLDGQLAELH